MAVVEQPISVSSRPHHGTSGEVPLLGHRPEKGFATALRHGRGRMTEPPVHAEGRRHGLDQSNLQIFIVETFQKKAKYYPLPCDVAWQIFIDRAFSDIWQPHPTARSAESERTD